MYKFIPATILIISGISAIAILLIANSAFINSMSQGIELGSPFLIYLIMLSLILILVAAWWVWSGVAILRSKPRPNTKFMWFGAIVGALITALIILFKVVQPGSNIAALVVAASTISFLIWPSNHEI